MVSTWIIWHADFDLNGVKLTTWRADLKLWKASKDVLYLSYELYPTSKQSERPTQTPLKAFVSFLTFRPKKTHHILIHIPNLLHQKADHWRSMEFFFWWWVSLVIFFPTENKRKSTKRRLVSGTCTEPQWDVFCVFFFPLFAGLLGGTPPKFNIAPENTIHFHQGPGVSSKPVWRSDIFWEFF